MNERATRIVLYVIAGLVLFYILSRVTRSVRSALMPIRTDEPLRELSRAERVQSENLAEEIYSEIYRTFPSARREELVNEIYQVDDSMLLHLARHYRNYMSGGVKLSEDLDSEWTIKGAEKLIGRLKSIKE